MLKHAPNLVHRFADETIALLACWHFEKGCPWVVGSKAMLFAVDLTWGFVGFSN